MASCTGELMDGRIVPVTPYLRWWFAHRPVLAGRCPAELRLPSAAELVGLYDPVPELRPSGGPPSLFDVDDSVGGVLDDELLAALGCRTGLLDVLEDTASATDLLRRLGDPPGPYTRPFSRCSTPAWPRPSPVSTCRHRITYASRRTLSCQRSRPSSSTSRGGSRSSPAGTPSSAAPTRKPSPNSWTSRWLQNSDPREGDVLEGVCRDLTPQNVTLAEVLRSRPPAGMISADGELLWNSRCGSVSPGRI